jgi:mono/diheme cytochrome c family protein
LVAFASTPVRSDLDSLRANTPPETAALENPLASDASAAERGQKLFLQRCALCHGNNGNGRGPAARGMKPKPLDFSHAARMESVTDGQLYWAIQNGSPGTPMPAWKSVMTEQEIWETVSFIKTLVKPE